MSCAGRKYKAVLQLDPSQAKAFINWGRVVGLRAEMARMSGAPARAGGWWGGGWWAAQLGGAVGLRAEMARMAGACSRAGGQWTGGLWGWSQVVGLWAEVARMAGATGAWAC